MQQQRLTSSYRNPQSKSNLKIVAGGGRGGNGKPPQLRAGGLEPTETMAPGVYTAGCKGGILTKKGQTTIAVLEFRIIDDGPHLGTALRQWLPIPNLDGEVPFASRYVRQCALALGREVELGEDLDPNTVFKGKLCEIEVGYRMTKKSGGGEATSENAKIRKDARDFLRVHQIVAIREELP